jgi:uncharacterized cofD-like protein
VTVSRIVAVGGGHGLARALKSLCAIGVEPTAVVTVADDGGSSGRLRRELGVIAPGDLRMALLAMSRNDALSAALAHRFRGGQLEGHALGNLLLVGLAEQHGGFVPALAEAGALLDCAGQVLPSTTSSVHLHAQVSGTHVDGQAHITRANGRVERVWLEPEEPQACPQAVESILTADTVVLGPGSLYTSVIANLLVPGIRSAVTETAARLVYVANLRTQPGETSGLDASAHVAALRAYLGGRTLDVAVLHDGPIPDEGGAAPLGTQLPADAAAEVVCADLAERVAGRPGGAHDVARLGEALRTLIAGRGMRSATA